MAFPALLLTLFAVGQPSLAQITLPIAAREGNNFMIPDSCRKEDLLPGVTEMTLDYPQRIAYPPGSENATGVYGPMTNGQRISLHLNPKVREGVGAIAGALLRHGALDHRYREMIIVRIGYVENSVYEVVQHGSLAESVGVPKAKLDALACKTPKGLDAAEQALITFVDEQLAKSRASDAALAGMRAHFSESQLVEAIVVIGNWWMLSRLVETAGVPVDARRIGAAGVAKE
jgi:alkylhydroperoxidase family enzyme